MLRSAIPLRFSLPFAKNAAGAFIRTVPVTSQIGIQDGAASFNDGFVPDNFTALAGGGVPPFGQDFNGILNITTTWDVWYQAGAPITYDSTFSTAQGGYPQGAVLDSAVVLGAQWYSLVDSNTTNPDDPLTSANWARVGIPVGQPTPFIGSVPAGFASMNGLTIGSGASGSTLADASTLFLYCYNWLQFSNTQCPIFTSAGSPTTRGANAVADFNANKRLQTLIGQGLSMIGVDQGSSFLSSVPVISGNTTTPGSVYGENLHTLASSEVPATAISATTGTESAGHTHPYLAYQNGGGPAGIGTGGVAQVIIQNSVSTGTESALHNHAVSGSVSGGGGSHNTVHRTMGVNWGQKL